MSLIAWIVSLTHKDEEKPKTETDQNDVKEEAPKEKKPLTGWQKFVRALVLIFHWVFSAKGLTTFIFVGYFFIYIDYRRQTYIIEVGNYPEEFKKSAINERVIANTIESIKNKILQFEPPIHDQYYQDLEYLNQSTRKNVGGIVKNAINPADRVTTISSEHADVLSEIKIEGVPFRTMIYLTDRLLNFIGFNVKNNGANINIYTDNDNVHCEVKYKGKVAHVTLPKQGLSSTELMYNCSYASAIFILSNTAPDKLIDYYLITGDKAACIRECIKVISTASDKEIISKGHFVWGLAANGNSIGYDQEIKTRLEKAVEIDASNIPAQQALLSLSDDFEKYEAGVMDQLGKDSSKYSNWFRLIDLNLSKTFGDDSISTDSAFHIVEPVYNNMVRVLGKTQLKDPYASIVHWYYGKVLQGFGDEDEDFKHKISWYDLAIAKFNKAIEQETSMKAPDLEKISEYYNAIAYTYQVQTMARVKLRSDICYNSMPYDLDLLEGLQKSFYYSQQSIHTDSLNSWAWSTMGEYYGLLSMIGRDKDLKEKAFECLAKAQMYGDEYDVVNYTYAEPYCHLLKWDPERFNQISKVKKYFSGPLAPLKRLRIVTYQNSGLKPATPLP